MEGLSVVRGKRVCALLETGDRIDGDEMWSFVPAPGPKRRRLQRAKVTQLVGASRRGPHQVPRMLGAVGPIGAADWSNINKGALATSSGSWACPGSLEDLTCEKAHQPRGDATALRPQSCVYTVGYLSMGERCVKWRVSKSYIMELLLLDLVLC